MNCMRLKGIRVSKGYTQEVLAEELGISTKTYNRKELGIIEFNRKEIAQLIDILDLDDKEVFNIFFTVDLPNV